MMYALSEDEFYLLFDRPGIAFASKVQVDIVSTSDNSLHVAASQWCCILHGPTYHMLSCSLLPKRLHTVHV